MRRYARPDDQRRRAQSMLIRRRAAAFAALTALLAGLAACGSSEDENTLTMYSGRIAPILSPAVKLYEDASGFKVKTRYGDSPSLVPAAAPGGCRSQGPRPRAGRPSCCPRGTCASRS
jgi:hypothetical protein